MDQRELRKRIKQLVDDNPHTYCAQLAPLLLEELSDRDIKRFALKHIENEIAEVRRVRARRVEVRSTQAAPPPPPPPARTQEHNSYAGNEAGRRACRACGCEGCIAALVEKEEMEAGFSRELWAGVRRTMDEYASAIRLEVTEELLASTFALGDGRQVTWGEATVEDHKTRIKLLETNAVKNLETAAKHQAAINMLEEAAASTLSDFMVAA